MGMAGSRGTGCARRAASRAADLSHLQQHALPYSDIPGPRALPLIGNTWRLLPFIGEYQVSDVARVSQLLHQRYGDIVKLSGLVGRPDLLFVYNCDEIERVYRHEGDTPYRPSMPCLVRYKSVVRKNFFGRLAGVVGVHGEEWRQFRTMVQKPILQPRTVRKYIAPIEDVTRQFIDRMCEIRDENGEMPTDFDNWIHKWSLECIGRVALDTRLGCLQASLPQGSPPQRLIDAAKFALRSVAELELRAPFWRYLPTPLWARYVSNMDLFVRVCSEYIDEAVERLQRKMAAGDSEGELSLLERILADNPDPKVACVLALDLVLVGIDTISMAVCSVLYQLATRPQEQQKIHEELVRLLPSAGMPLDPHLLDRMLYLKAFVKEVFRKYSTVIGNGRTVQQDTVICGYRVPQGVQLVFPTLVTGNMDRYVTDADRFAPERWLKGTGSWYIHPFASLPFGHGARMCLGRRFADLEIHILLARLLRLFKLEYNHDPLQYKVTFMYAPDGPLRFKVTPRS